MIGLAATIAPPPPWTAHAACAEVDPDLWFPEQDAGATNRLAKAICRGCPVIADCLQDALDRGEPHGVWGGLTSPERRRLLRDQAVAA